MKKTFSLIVLLCFFLIISACGQEEQQETTTPGIVSNRVPEITVAQAETQAAIGNPAPDFTLVDMEGKTWTLSTLKGQVVFLNFWATWCPPCVQEMPSMQNLYTTLPEDQFKMLAVLNNDDPANAKAFSEKLGITIPILYDQKKLIGTTYGLTAVPETFIIDKQGIIREKIIGPAQWDSPDEVQMLLQYINR